MKTHGSGQSRECGFSGLLVENLIKHCKVFYDDLLQPMLQSVLANDLNNGVASRGRSGATSFRTRPTEMDATY
jgi:hypothetical protein